MAVTIGRPGFLGLQIEIEGLRLGGRKQFVGAVQRAEHRLLLVVGNQIAVGIAIDEIFEERATVGETSGIHALGRAHGELGFAGEGEIHRPELRTEESAGGEGFEFLAFAVAFEPLADVDKGRHDGIARAEHLRHPRADVWRGDGLRRHVAGVPVVLMAGMQNRPEIRLHGRADKSRAIHHFGNIFEALADFNIVHRGIDFRKSG